MTSQIRENDKVLRKDRRAQKIGAEPMGKSTKPKPLRGGWPDPMPREVDLSRPKGPRGGQPDLYPRGGRP